jgi:hypothetical protein
MVALGYSISDKGVKGVLQALVNVTGLCQLLRGEVRTRIWEGTITFDSMMQET